MKGFVTPTKSDTGTNNNTNSNVGIKGRKGFVVPTIQSSSSSKENEVVQIKKTTTSSTSSSSSKPKVIPPSATTTSSSSTTTTYYKVMWCATTTKKHKTFMDGVILWNATKKIANLIDLESGKDIGKSSSVKLTDLAKEGYKSTMSGKDFEVVGEITEREYNQLLIDNKSTTSTTTTSSSSNQIEKETSKSKKTVGTLKGKKRKIQEDEEEEEEAEEDRKQSYTTIQFKENSIIGKTKTKQLKSLFDPNASNALILYTPSDSDLKASKKTHVVVDPYLSSQLRPHQRRGVQFMFRACTSDSSRETGEDGGGAILADQMGLGKTLQAITLVWTMVCQGMTGSPLAKKAMIVAPATLLGNWCAEFSRWLGSSRLQPATLTDIPGKSCAKHLEDWNEQVSKPVLIISYEQCRSLSKQLKSLNGIGLVIADEGHRLKNSSSLTSKAVMGIPTNRRVVLSGTPVQNDLEEFYAMVDFTNPGKLGSLADFKREFATPIQRSRDAGKNASNSPKDAGVKAAVSLSKLTSSFILRRKSNILEKYLPPKCVHIIFCKLSPLQSQLYKTVLGSSTISSVISGGESSLASITLLKKLCNSPVLVKDEEKLKSKFPSDFDVNDTTTSGKLQFVEQLLTVLQSIGDKVVLVSNYTQTLDVFETLCTKLGRKWLRLDGQVNADERQLRVDRFNDPSNKTFNTFLLSAKAGGMGINLIGGNHIVLFDPDWNPAIDIQAMERVWREGQKKNVSIYRLLSSGTIEEKIYQRQLMKESISNSIIDRQYREKSSFSSEELKDIFSYQQDTICETHDLLQCKCIASKSTTTTTASTNNDKVEIFKQIDHLEKWSHFNQSNISQSADTHSTTFKSNSFPSISFMFKGKLKTQQQREQEEKEEEQDESISFFNTEDCIEDEDDQDGGEESTQNGDKDDKSKSTKPTKKQKITNDTKNKQQQDKKKTNSKDNQDDDDDGEMILDDNDDDLNINTKNTNTSTKIEKKEVEEDEEEHIITVRRNRNTTVLLNDDEDDGLDF